MQVIGGLCPRYWDMVALADRKPVKVIGASGIMRDKPGFEVDFITRGSASEKMHSARPAFCPDAGKGHWRVTWSDGSTVLAPGDTMSVPENLPHNAPCRR
jgi:hypothetical protein